MAIIPKYTLNEKFENGKKPPQWDFWAWQDSYWHKEEKIPTSAIEGLDATLLKKADLVDGMVPESQLPFSVVTSEVLALGKVEIIDNKVKLEVHSSGANKVRVKGKLITRIFPNEWSFTPIVGSGIKVLRGYALKNEDDFFMVEGAELPEMTDPEIPENALQLFKLTISSAGVIVEEETEEVFKYRSDDNWRPLIINSNNGVWLPFGGTGASSFNITVSDFVTTPKIVGISTKITKNIWNGKEIVLFIDSSVPVAIVKDQILPISPNATFINFAEDYILQPKSYNLIKQKGNQIVVVKYGGGSASFPVAASNGLVLESDSAAPEKVKWVEKLKGFGTNMINAWDGSKWFSTGLKYVAGVIPQLEFVGRIKADAIILPNNTTTPIANRLRSDGSELFFANDLGVERSLSAAYKAEYQESVPTSTPITGVLNLKRSYEKVITGNDGLGNTSSFTVALETPRLGVVNEYVLILKTGANLPTINYPTGIRWRGKSPLILNTTTTYTYVFEYVYMGLLVGWEVYGTYIENEK